LDQRSRYGPKLNIRLYPLEDGIVGQVRIANDLAVIGRIPCNPMFQLDHQPRVLDKNRFDFCRGGRHPAQVLQCQIRCVGHVGRVGIPLLRARRIRVRHSQEQESSGHK
jgi:hypothetical protein